MTAREEPDWPIVVPTTIRVHARRVQHFTAIRTGWDDEWHILGAVGGWNGWYTRRRGADSASAPPTSVGGL